MTNIMISILQVGLLEMELAGQEVQEMALVAVAVEVLLIGARVLLMVLLKLLISLMCQMIKVVGYIFTLIDPILMLTDIHQL